MLKLGAVLPHTRVNVHSLLMTSNVPIVAHDCTRIFARTFYEHVMRVVRNILTFRFDYVSKLEATLKMYIDVTRYSWQAYNSQISPKCLKRQDVTII